MNKEFYNFQDVISRAGTRIDEVVMHLFPQAKKQNGNYRLGGINGERGSSLSISTRPNNAGQFVDHADPSVKGNVIGLWATAKSISYDEAGRELAAFVNILPEERIITPKKRSEPKIHLEERSFVVGNNKFPIEPLNKKSIEYAESRGISEDTLKKTKCFSSGGNIVFPHFDEENTPVLMKCWSCDGNKAIFTNNDPIHVLFGKHLIDPVKHGSLLIITEGQWDALSWIQMGYPAVSIPSGANNQEWINEDYNFLNRFSSIYLDFDDDSVGREAEAAVKRRLGSDRCRSIKYPFKDANDAIKAKAEGVLVEALNNAITAPVENILDPNSIKEEVRKGLSQSGYTNSTPFFIDNLKLEFVPHEIIIWYGYTSQGKSTLLSNQVAFTASKGKMCMVASFEQTVGITTQAMLVQYTADGDIGIKSDFDRAYDDLMSKVIFYNSMDKTSPDELIATMARAHKQLGVEIFVIDNIMTLDIDRQDNSAQADYANKFREFAYKYPVELHLVAHPRKSKEGDNKPPSLQEIMGASEWGNMAHTIICVWRDISKEERLSEMMSENMDPMAIMKFNNEVPDGKVFVRKQRKNGELRMTSYWFDRIRKRAYKNTDDLVPYWESE